MTTQPPIRVPCEGAHQPGNGSGPIGAWCRMCGRLYPLDADDLMPTHDRDDVLAMIDRGDYDNPRRPVTAEPDTTRTRLTALADENTRLRRGLQQIIDGDYPAEAGNAETWAAEVLADPGAVGWEDEQA